MTNPKSQILSNKTAVGHPLLSRKSVNNPHIDHSKVNKQRVFSIASYNILAESHAIKALQKGTLYTWSTEEKLRNEYRHELLWKELEYLDADIYCLQEVPPKYFEDVLLPAFRAKGFEGVYIKRTHVDYEEGEAIFYNTERFTLIKSHGYSICVLVQKNIEGLSETNKAAIIRDLQKPDVFMLTQLKCNQTGIVLSVANIHVAWDLKRSDIQRIQIAAAINELVAQAGGSDKPHIICGDFNSTPDSPGYQLARYGYLSEKNVKLLQEIQYIDMPNGDKTSLVDSYRTGFQHTSNTLKSAYKTVQDVEPKTFDDPISSLDYIWFSSDTLQVTEVLETFDVKFWAGGIPNAIIPSDHMSIYAEIEILL